MDRPLFDANEARMLDKLRRHYETLLQDEFLRKNVIGLELKYKKVMDKINAVTDPILEENIYSIGGISKPLN